MATMKDVVKMRAKLRGETIGSLCVKLSLKRGSFYLKLAQGKEKFTEGQLVQLLDILGVTEKQLDDDISNL